MATRYKVTGGTNWNDTAGWSTTSGGAGGSSAPTNSDDVFFDANSNNCTLNVATPACKSLDCTGYTGTISGTPTVFSVGQGTTPLILKFSAAMTYSASGSLGLATNDVPANRQVALAGKTVAAMITAPIVSTNGLQFQDAISVTGAITATSAGIRDFNAKNVTAGSISLTGSNARTLTFTNCAVSLTGTGTVWNAATTTNLTLTTTGATITIADTSSTGKTFAGGGLTYAANIAITGGTGAITFTGNNTFNGTFTANAPLTLTSTTQTFGSTLTLNSGCTAITGGTISKSSGTVTAPSGCTITNNAASGGATFDASAAIDGGGNSGWDFGEASAVGGFSLMNVVGFASGDDEGDPWES